MTMGAQIILGNTFHLWLRARADVIAPSAGCTCFEGWRRPILTDSGGFQVWSLGAMRKISEEGRALRVAGQRRQAPALTPEVSMQIQTVLGSDIVMQFDSAPYLRPKRAGSRPRPRRARRWSSACAGPAQPRASSPAGQSGTRCSASCRAACSSTCARRRLEQLVALDLPATRSAASASASQRQMLRIMAHTPPARRPQAIPDGRGTPKTSSRAWPAAWTCSTA